jgi:beta-galactosidase
VSGTNFGFSNALNNWGDPLALLTSDYDFHGMISPSGDIRPEYSEGRLFSSLLQTFGTALALAEPVPSFLEVKGSLPKAAGMRYLLKLEGGGYLLSLPNIGDTAGTINISGEEVLLPRFSELSVAAHSCPLLPFNLPLAKWGVRGTLIYATAELFAASIVQNVPNLLFSAEGSAEISLRLPEGTEATGKNAVIRSEAGGVTLICRVLPAVVEIKYPDGTAFEIRVFQHEEAKKITRITEDGNIHYSFKFEREVRTEPFSETEWCLSPALEKREESKSVPENDNLYLEKHGIYRGYAWYKARFPKIEETLEWQGILLEQASDILSIYVDGSYQGTVVPGGQSRFVPLIPTDSALESCEIRTEIWGHTNFDDKQLPSLRQSSMKGILGAIAVANHSNCKHNWRYRLCDPLTYEREYPDTSSHPNDHAVIDWGSWIHTGKLETGLYTKVFNPSQFTRKFLHFHGNQARVVIFVNKALAGELNYANPFFDLSPYTIPGRIAEISIYLERSFRESAGSLSLIEGYNLTDWTIGSAQEMQLWEDAGTSLSEAKEQKVPLRIVSGATAWLHKCWRDEADGVSRLVHIAGSGAKVTALFNGKVVGRLWLPSTEQRPIFTGGSQDRIYLPGVWLQEGSNQLSLLIEAVEAGQFGVIENIRFERIIMGDENE